MKPSTLLNLAVAGRLAMAGVPAERTYTARGAALVARDHCSQPGELLVYRTEDRFVCIGKTVFWTGAALTTISVAVASDAASQFATWVINKVKGEPSTTEGKRDVAEKQADKWFEDEESVTYGWTPPTLGARTGVSSHIHNMTVTYSKGTGFMTQAEMTFDGEHDPIGNITVAKRSSTPITITYYAVSGHEGTKLGYDDLYNLFHQIFVSSPGGVGSECGYAANSGTWHGAFKATVSGAPDAGSCYTERQF
ncbi:hypothetical protein ONZ43_g6413 [Nemania bipapillata]|uniref:Uncharacterized protein n=1 Tax=Nemania bipapillata TaxID=110536 RepID=A0ACC2HZS6_9PEZI|nr:hypothetical protein ONZ43_g6413 [Nemania bipapillata]